MRTSPSSMRIRLAILLMLSRTAMTFSLAPRNVIVGQSQQPTMKQAPVMTAPHPPVTALLLADGETVLSNLETFQQSHAFLISIVLAIATRLVINEIYPDFSWRVFCEGEHDRLLWSRYYLEEPLISCNLRT